MAQSDDERRELLITQGPRIMVVGRNPVGPIGARERKRMEALLDTGTSVNMIDLRAARSLGLIVIDERRMGHALGEQTAPVFSLRLTIPQLSIDFEGEFVGGDTGSGNSRFEVLLGRRFLSRYILNYDGLRGMFQLGSLSSPLAP